MDDLNLNDELKNYYKILCIDYPIWLNDYINTPEMQRINEISISCGTDYSGIYSNTYFLSNLHHSIGVALIIWKFTQDKKQTLAGLFHDIATPVFKHAIDYLNEDSEKQESTEEKTVDIIKNSMIINKLLKRDNIKLEEVLDYKMYPIADNNSPALSADRLEYTFTSGLTFKRVFDLELIEKIYNDIIVVKNENNIDELAFKTKEICELYIKTIYDLWISWIDDNDRTVLKFLADICKVMIKNNYITVDDLYNYSEKEIISKIKKCEDKNIVNAYTAFEKAKTAYTTREKVKSKYCVYTKTKIRYVNPLVKDLGRIYDVSKDSKNIIDKYLSFKKEGWTYFDFRFDID